MKPRLKRAEICARPGCQRLATMVPMMTLSGLPGKFHTAYAYVEEARRCKACSERIPPRTFFGKESASVLADFKTRYSWHAIAELDSLTKNRGEVK